MTRRALPVSPITETICDRARAADVAATRAIFDAAVSETPAVAASALESLHDRYRTICGPAADDAGREIARLAEELLEAAALHGDAESSYVARELIQYWSHETAVHRALASAAERDWDAATRSYDEVVECGTLHQARTLAEQLRRAERAARARKVCP